MKRDYSENEMRSKAEAYCSSAEHCVAEVEAKLEQWGAEEDVAERIVKHLVSERYIDQRRYSVAFVRDKYRFNQWGRAKISQALRVKKISADVIASSLEEINEQDYLTILSGLIAQKKKGLKAKTDYELNGKLIRFAVGRGFEMSAILQCIKGDIDEGLYMD